jgi:hypothetical protein
LNTARFDLLDERQNIGREQPGGFPVGLKSLLARFFQPATAELSRPPVHARLGINLQVLDHHWGAHGCPFSHRERIPIPIILLLWIFGFLN